MTLLMWVLPTILVIAAIVDALFAYIYMKYAHPWKGILEDPAPWEVIPEAYPDPSSSMKKLKVSPKKAYLMILCKFFILYLYISTYGIIKYFIKNTITRYLMYWKQLPFH